MSITIAPESIADATVFAGRLRLHPVQHTGTLPDSPYEVGQWGAHITPLIGRENVATVTQAWRSQITPGNWGIRYRATTPDGARWHGVAQENGELTKMYRCK